MEEKLSKLNKKIIDCKSIDILEGKIAQEILESIKKKPNALIGLSPKINFANIFDLLLKEISLKEFEKVTIALLSENILWNKRTRFEKFFNEALIKIKPNLKNFLVPIAHSNEKTARREVHYFAKKIQRKNYFDLIIPSFNLSENQIESLNEINLKGNLNQASLTYAENESQVGTIGLKEILNSKKIILIANDEIEQKAFKQLNGSDPFEEKFVFSAFNCVIDKITLYAVKSDSGETLTNQAIEEQLQTKIFQDINNLEPTKEEVTNNKESIEKFNFSQAINVKKLPKLEIIENFSSQKEESVWKNESIFYEDSIADNQDELLKYQSELKSKIFSVKEKINVLKTVNLAGKNSSKGDNKIELEVKVLEDNDNF